MTDADGLAAAISDQDPRYSFFRYSHDFEGKADSPIIFIYTCPTGSKLKERMLYASCRGGVVVAAGDAGLTIAKKVRDFPCSFGRVFRRLTLGLRRWKRRVLRRSQGPRLRRSSAQSEKRRLHSPDPSDLAGAENSEIS
jgi:Cofilin/tropomyosin-type actin-binding protein